MIKINEDIFLRAFVAEDENFWREVFFDSIREHFALLNLPKNELDALLESQFQAQTTDYRANYPKASNDVILYKNAAAGRVILSREADDLHLVDIAVLSEFRNLGIGTAILDWLFAESRRSKLPIRFYVEKNNRAVNLYQRLGFKPLADLTSHLQMEWRETT